VAIDHGDQTCVAACRRIEFGGRDRGYAGVNRTDLRRQNALVKSPVACAQYGSAIVCELRSDAQAWRHNVPRKQGAEAGDDAPCFTPLNIDRAEVLNDGAVLVETHTGIDRQPTAYRHGISRKKSSRDELCAVDRGTSGDGSKGFPVIVDEPHASRNDLRRSVQALFHLSAYLPLMIGLKQPAVVVGECRLSRRPNQRHRADQLWSAAVDTGQAVRSIRRREIPASRVVIARKDEASDSYVPQCVGG